MGPDATKPILGDPDRLRQVVWNLLSNAVKFTPGGGWVTLGLRHTSSGVTIEVSDSGAGIRSEFLSRVFDRFSQDGTTKGTRGLGLGLAIVRHLIELHGGTVSAESAGEGRGSTFKVTLPAI